MYKFAIIDDQKISYDIISKHIHNYFDNKNISIENIYYQDPLKFDFEVNYDAIFLDIDMPSQDGITFAKEFKKRKNTPIVFMTNHTQYIFSTLDVQPFHFIQKENIDTQVINVLNLLLEKIQKENIFVNIIMRDIIKKINYNDICYIHMNDHICMIHAKDNSYQTWDSLSSLYEQLCLYDFVKINRSTLINFKYVTKFDGNTIILNENITFPISTRLKQKIFNQYQEYVMRCI